MHIVKDKNFVYYDARILYFSFTHFQTLICQFELIFYTSEVFADAVKHLFPCKRYIFDKRILIQNVFFKESISFMSPPFY